MKATKKQINKKKKKKKKKIDQHPHIECGDIENSTRPISINFG